MRIVTHRLAGDHPRHVPRVMLVHEMPRVLDLDQLGPGYLAGEPARRSDRHDAVGGTGDDRGWDGDLTEPALQYGQVAAEEPLLTRERAPRGAGEEQPAGRAKVAVVKRACLGDPAPDRAGPSTRPPPHIAPKLASQPTTGVAST